MPPKKAATSTPSKKVVAKPAKAKAAKKTAPGTSASAAAAASPPATKSTPAAAAAAVELPGLTVPLKQLAGAVLTDPQSKVVQSGRWPLIIDPSERAATFMRYRDSNYIDALSKEQMEPHSIRLALLGAIRYGKPFVLDMMDADIFDSCVAKFDLVQKGLMDDILDKSLLVDEKYRELVQKTDGEEYAVNQVFVADDFKFVIITKLDTPGGGILKKTFPVRIET